MTIQLFKFAIFKKFLNLDTIFVAKLNFTVVFAFTYEENLSLSLHGDFSMDSDSVDNDEAMKR